MIRSSALAAFALGLAGPVAAQSMNVGGIVENVAGSICPAFMAGGDIRAGIRAGEAAGYRVVDSEPDNRGLATDPDALPRAVEMRGSHAGVLRMSVTYGNGLCSIGIAEGGVGRIAEYARPHMRALGLRVELAPAEGPTAVAVWGAGDRRAVALRSPHHLPGSELVFSFRVAQ